VTTRVLIADDEVNLRTVLGATLRRAGYEVAAVADGAQALDAIEESWTEDPVGVVVSDLRMPRGDGMSLLRELRQRHPELPVIIITAHGTVDTAVAALKAGAFDYVTKPFEQDELLTVIAKAVATRVLGEAETHASDSAPGLLIGDSAPMQAVIDVIERVAETPTTVLLTGESGTGKELVATAIHRRSGRAERPLIKINCAAIPKDLMESELFGYDQGAYTGATKTKPGRFELADAGTLFLDEIAEIPVEMQVKLLRALQEGEFEHVGGVKTIRVDVRLITATNSDLNRLVREGSFREDLFYRLNVVPVRLPPLRERPEDIPLLVEHFVIKFNARLKRAVRAFSPQALRVLHGYPWPGNIRELENVVERTLLFADRDVIEADDLPPEILVRADALSSVALPSPDARGGEGAESLKDIVRRATAHLERDLIRQALQETGGNVTRAARRLKISRKSLQTKMRELGLRDEP